MELYDWDREPEGVRWAWNSAIDRALKDPEIQQYHDAEIRILSKHVLRNCMHDRHLVAEALQAEQLYRERIRPLGRRRAAARRSLRDVRDTVPDRLIEWIFPIALVGGICTLILDAPWWVNTGLAAVLVALTVRALLDATHRASLTLWIKTSWCAVVYVGLYLPELFYLCLWTYTRLPKSQVPYMRREIARLLGPRRESLLVFRNHRGLIHAHDPHFWVSTHIEDALKRKLDQMDGGAIAICGPRGVGKSTLLRKACVGALQRGGPWHFHVVVQTPANYRPEEFLISLFQQVCLRYLALYGRRARGPFMFRVRTADLPRRITRALHGGVYLLLGLAALVVALRAPLEWLYSWGADGAQQTATALWRTISTTAARWWTDHPAISRIVLILVGAALISESGILRWPFDHRYRKLIADCNNYLHLLRHTQNASNAASLGLPRVVGITLGGSRTTGQSSRTLSYPELVDHFRELLTRISRQERDDDSKVFIGIDELDRLGSAEQAKAFLAEIKPIFTIPGVYFVLTVSEDIGASFVRRGIASRDVTDSSLEDVHYLERRRLPEARALLQQRVPGCTDPFVALVHALAGGIPRDLIRYTRKLVEIRHRTGDPSLISLAGHLLREEITQTLSALRVVLGEQTHTPELGQRLHTLHAITNLANELNARDADDLERLQGLVTRLVLPELETPLGADLETPPGNGDEVSTYALFALTLLQVFTEPDFTERHREQRQFQDPDGDLDHLATIRLEMSMSPRSARLMMERFRRAWGLEVPPTLPGRAPGPDPHTGTPRR
ncbi:hypothetical protein OG426_55160 (plasmid) [Streptomyces canus]|uniref:hypothetical protein n=1 Tax=Streptomyces canus TaxID=58343 RepID=UPI002F9170DF|nr:hypothetical protein OG426_55160 [Streptomyces canus]